MTKNSTAVKIDNLTKAFNGVEVLQNLYINIPKNSIYGLLGNNGAGKTTLLKIIAGLLTPSSGIINIDGLDIRSNRTEILRKLGCLIDTPIFYEHLSARSNLKIHLEYMGIADKSNIETTLNKVGLENISEQPVSTFSLGMRQRLAIARAIIHNPDILLLDEPINGLDPTGIKEMRMLFLSLMENENKTIIISSHILNEIEQTATIIGVLAKGRIEEEISLKDKTFSSTRDFEDYVINIMNGDN